MPPPPEGELVSQFYISLSSLCDTGHPSPPAEKKEPRKAAHLTGVYVEVQVGRSLRQNAERLLGFRYCPLGWPAGGVTPSQVALTHISSPQAGQGPVLSRRSGVIWASSLPVAADAFRHSRKPRRVEGLGPGRESWRGGGGTLLGSALHWFPGRASLGFV